MRPATIQMPFQELRDFAVDFDEGSPTTVLVVANGTGKSNCWRRDDHLPGPRLGRAPSFDYAMEYVCRGTR